MKSLRSKLVVSATLVLFAVSLMISVTYYFLFRNTLTEEFSKSRTDTLLLISKGIDNTLQSMNTIADLFFDDTTLSGIMLSDDLSAVNLASVRSHADSLYLKYYMAFQNSQIPFYVVATSENGFCYSSSERNYAFSGIGKASWHIKNRSLNNDSYLVSSYFDASLEEPRYVCACVRVLRKPNGDYAGTVMVCIDERNLYSRYAGILNGSNSIYVLDDMLRVISSPDETQIGSSVFPIAMYSFLLGNQDYTIVRSGLDANLFSKHVSPVSSWTIVEKVRLDSVVLPFSPLLSNMILVVALVLPFVFLCARRLAKRIVSPMTQLVKYVEKATGADGLNQYEEIGGYLEIDQLCKSFNDMKRQLSSLLSSIQANEKRLRAAELEAMHAQINPHFIYNTLFSIKCTIQMGKEEDACEMLSLLITLLRATIGSPGENTTLKEEVQYLSTYVALQNHRFNNRLSFTCSIPSDLTACCIPRSLLQPLVENSILHGIMPHDGDGHIHFSANTENEDLLLDLYDDGVGISAHPQEESAEREHCGHIGIANVDSRIRLHFGSRYGLSFIPVATGTCIRLRLPKIT